MIFTWLPMTASFVQGMHLNLRIKWIHVHNQNLPKTVQELYQIASQTITLNVFPSPVNMEELWICMTKKAFFIHVIQLMKIWKFKGFFWVPGEFSFRKKKRRNCIWMQANSDFTAIVIYHVIDLINSTVFCHSPVLLDSLFIFFLSTLNFITVTLY